MVFQDKCFVLTFISQYKKMKFMFRKMKHYLGENPG